MDVHAAGPRQADLALEWLLRLQQIRTLSLPSQHRLALEMALHEEAERRALEGELLDLELAWKEAEEIAAIADDLLLPDSVQAAFEQLKRSRS